MSYKLSYELIYILNSDSLKKNLINISNIYLFNVTFKLFSFKFLEFRRLRLASLSGFSEIFVLAGFFSKTQAGFFSEIFGKFYVFKSNSNKLLVIRLSQKNKEQKLYIKK